MPKGRPRLQAIKDADKLNNNENLKLLKKDTSSFKENLNEFKNWLEYTIRISNDEGLNYLSARLNNTKQSDWNYNQLKELSIWANIQSQFNSRSSLIYIICSKELFRISQFLLTSLKLTKESSNVVKSRNTDNDTINLD